MLKRLHTKSLNVYDGDTVKLRPIGLNKTNNDIKLRLTDIDAPERESRITV
jgi:endonuclease YncB( thermonuclease family)